MLRGRRFVTRYTKATAHDRQLKVNPSDVLDHATSEIASGSKLGIDAMKNLPGEGFKRFWPPLIKMDAAMKAKIDALFNRTR